MPRLMTDRPSRNIEDRRLGSNARVERALADRGTDRTRPNWRRDLYDEGKSELWSVDAGGEGPASKPVLPRTQQARFRVRMTGNR